MKERLESCPLVRLRKDEQQRDHPAHRRQQGELARRNPRSQQQGAQRERDHQRGTHVGLENDQQARRPGHDRDRRDQWQQARADPLRVIGEVPGGVEHQGQLHELRGLEFDRARGKPAPCTVDLPSQPRDQHQHQQGTRADQKDAQRALIEQRQTTSGENLHGHQSNRRKQHVADECPGAQALTG